MNVDFVIHTQALRKYYGDVHAVENISLNVPRGEIFGFLGLNGAGKSTTIGMLLGAIYPTSGKIWILGQEVSPLHTRPLRQVGSLIEAPAFTPYLSARQNLKQFALLYPELPAGRVDQIIEMVGLQDAGKRVARHFSTGMKQRLGVAIALFNQPELLILDEPANGLDPAGVHEMRQLLHTLKDQGVTIFLSSHLLHEIELICDRVAVIQQGRLIAEGTVEELLHGKTDTVRIVTAFPAQTAKILQLLPEASHIQEDMDKVFVQGVSTEAVLAHLFKEGFAPKEVSLVHADLETVFLKLTEKI